MPSNPIGETTIVPCRGCSRGLSVPCGPVKSAHRAGQFFVTFCSKRCEKKYIAKQGTKQQEMNLAQHSDSNAS